ncbi:MAG: hypothetical protein AAFU49_19580 [Pseudomonadota bacterium]
MSGTLSKRDVPLIDPSGRPLKNAGFEAVVALGIVLVWIVVLVLVFWSMGDDRANAGPAATFMLAGVGLTCWFLAAEVAGRRNLVWPGSALGIVGPLSLGFALALSTPELRVGPFQTRLAIVSMVAAVGMIPFLFRFRLPGLVSPVVTFMLVGLFLTLFGTDMERLRQVEGFSPRGIVASLLDQPLFAIAFGGLAVWAAVTARRLDLNSDDFGLAAARPLHLMGCGVCALMVGRVLGMLPGPLDLIAVLAAFAVAWIYALRINRIAVLFAMQMAMVKPLVMSITEPLGLRLDVSDWTWIVLGIVALELATWPTLHRISRARNWTLGPGGRIPPLEHPGWIWRYWPYATQEGLTRWAAEKTRRREAKAARREEKAARRAARRQRRSRPPAE